MALSRPAAARMRWLTNLRLAGDDPALAEAGWRWRVGVDDEGRIARVRPTPPGSRAGGEDWGGDWLSPGGWTCRSTVAWGWPSPN